MTWNPKLVTWRFNQNLSITFGVILLTKKQTNRRAQNHDHLAEVKVNLRFNGEGLIWFNLYYKYVIFSRFLQYLLWERISYYDLKITALPYIVQLLTSTAGCCKTTLTVKHRVCPLESSGANSSTVSNLHPHHSIGFLFKCNKDTMQPSAICKKKKKYTCSVSAK